MIFDLPWLYSYQNRSQCVLLIVSHWFWLFLRFWYYFWSAWSEVSCQMRQGCRIHHWPGRPQFQLPVLIRSKHVVPCLNTNTGHLKFSLVLHNFCAIYGKSFCGNTDCNSFELPTQSVVRSWFPTWRTSLHNFACNALCAWALGLEDCTWQQIHNDNAQNTNRQKQSETQMFGLYDPFSARPLPGIFSCFLTSLTFSKKGGCPFLKKACASFCFKQLS